MLSALLIVLGAVFSIFYFTRRFAKNGMSNPKNKLIKVIANNYIGFKKQIALVEVPGALLVLGITNDRISLLSKIDNDTMINTVYDAGEEKSSPFADHLKKLSVKFKTVKSSE
jgi:flagellar protein FliO/FliZ